MSFPPLSLLNPRYLPDPRQGLRELAESGQGCVLGGWREGGRLAGTHGAPRAFSPAPPTPPGRALECREGARTARCGWSCAARLSRRVRAGRAAGSAYASEVGSPAGPLCRSPRQASRAAPRRARRLWPCATEAPPPPRLSARLSPPRRAEWLRTAVSALAAQAPAPAAGCLLTSGRRNPEEEEEKKKKIGTRAEGEKLYFFLL